jgi:hypothetical protein
VGLALQAVDGTKIQAAASDRTGWNKERMEKLLAALDAALDQTEWKIVQENAELEKPADRLPAGLAQRQALRAQIQAGLAQLAADGRGHYHPVEPEARVMKVGDTHRFAYNAQAVADEKEGVIVACAAIRQETDTGQLVPMIEQARENLDLAASDTETLADTGYGAGADLQAAAEKQMRVLAPPLEGKPARGHPYATQHFHYDATQKTVTCPRGVVLAHEGHTWEKDQRIERYRCHCADCPARDQCTRDPKGRRLEVRPHTAVVQAMRAQLRTPAIYQRWSRRREIIEPRFGQIKQHEHFRRWTVWGLEAVKTQWALLCAALNLRVLYRKWCERRGGGDAVGAAVALPRASAWALNVARVGVWVARLSGSILARGKNATDLPWSQWIFPSPRAGLPMKSF